MARLGDVPKLFRSIGPWAFAKRVFLEISKDNLFTWAAALAYSWLFAIFPFFIFLLALVPYLPVGTRRTARIEIHNFVLAHMPKEAAETIWKNIDNNLNNLLHQPRNWLLYVGLLVALWAASGGMAATMAALDRCYEIERGRSFHQQRLMAITLTIIAAALLLAVVCLLPVGTLVKKWVIEKGLVEKQSPLLVIFDVARWVIAILFMISALTLIYYKGPAVKHRFYWLTPGAAFCLIVWIVLGLLFRVYIDGIGGKGYDKTYGTVGGVAVLLLFFYIDAVVLLIGAEINSEIDFEVLKIRRGARDFREAEKLDEETPTAL